MDRSSQTKTTDSYDAIDGSEVAENGFDLLYARNLQCNVIETSGFSFSSWIEFWVLINVQKDLGFVTKKFSLKASFRKDINLERTTFDVHPLAPMRPTNISATIITKFPHVIDKLILAKP